MIRVYIEAFMICLDYAFPGLSSCVLFLDETNFTSPIKRLVPDTRIYPPYTTSNCNDFYSRFY